MIKRYFIIAGVFILIFSVSLTGCQTGNNLAPSAPDNNTPNATEDALPQTIGQTAPPKQLETIESDSEDIIDDLGKSDWTAAKIKIDEMKTALNELKPQLQSANISADLINGVQTSLTELEKRAADKQIYQSKVQANAITKFIPDIADAYEAPLPTDLGRLDYYGREILLNVEIKDWPAASGNIIKMKEIWLKLKKQLGYKYKNDRYEFDKTVNNLVNSIGLQDAASTTEEANRILEEIDTLEKDFSDQKK